MCNDIETIPNEKNFCGGNFQDWLEVMLDPRCNGKCSWCIDKNGYHPKERVSWQILAETALSTGKKNIILLGGEPTLYPDLCELVACLSNNAKNVYITTNGSVLSPSFVDRQLKNITGVNISIHHYSLDCNRTITGLYLYKDTLKEAIQQLHSNGAVVRINCNCISGYIDSKSEIYKFIDFAKSIGADGVRFAELKNDDKFVDLAEMFNHKYGLNDDPFVHGCNQDVIINDMPVNFRQMCGLQTKCRKLPINPKQFIKDVLYYDGKLYKGWQEEKTTMADKEIKTLIKSILVAHSHEEISLDEAINALMNIYAKSEARNVTVSMPVVSTYECNGSGCCY